MRGGSSSFVVVVVVVFFLIMINLKFFTSINGLAQGSPLAFEREREREREAMAREQLNTPKAFV